MHWKHGLREEEQRYGREGERTVKRVREKKGEKGKEEEEEKGGKTLSEGKQLKKKTKSLAKSEIERTTTTITIRTHH